MTKAWLLMVSLAAMAFMAPCFLDPYQAPRLVLLAALCVPLLLRRSQHRSFLELDVMVGLLAWVVCACFTKDVSYTLVGSCIAPFDSLSAVLMYAGLAVGVARLGCNGEQAAEAIVISSIPVSLYAILQHFVADPLLVAPLPGGRVVASQGSPVYLGAVLAVAAACALGLARKRGGRAPLEAVALALMAPALWFTGTRGALLAVAAAAFVLVQGKKKYLLLGVLPFVAMARKNVVGSDMGRIENYKMAWKMFLAHPVFGVGPGAYTMEARKFITASYVAANHSSLVAPQHAHNQVLQVLAITGLLGLVAYCTILYSCWQVAKVSKDKVILLAAAAAYAVVASLNPVPHAVTAMMIILFGAASTRWDQDGLHVVRVPLALACCVSMVLAGRIMASDYYMMNAVRTREDVQRKVALAWRLNPWELRIAAQKIDVDMAAVAHEPLAIRKAVAEECVELAHQAVLMHPGDASAHEVYGRIVLMAHMLGVGEDPREAMLAYNYAQALAPTWYPLMLRRRAVAAQLGYKDEFLAAQADIARIHSWEAQ